jgi:ABC-type histidine transport system ATPase subunit
VGEVLQVIKTLAGEGLTMVVVTHEMGFASEISTEVVYLREGKIEERGSPAEIFQNPGSPSLQSFLSRFRK